MPAIPFELLQANRQPDHPYPENNQADDQHCHQPVQQHRNYAITITGILNLHTFPNQAALLASTSILRVTLSPRPGKKALTPKSKRLISAVAANPAVSLLVTGLVPILFILTFSVTGFVTPCKVNIPLTFAESLPVRVTLSLTNAAVGYLATSKN